MESLLVFGPVGWEDDEKLVGSRVFCERQKGFNISRVSHI